MKKLICLLLAVALLAACSAPAEETAPTEDDKLRLEIGGTEESFEPWEQAGLPTEGSFYLTQDVVLETQLRVEGSLKLHLNGHSITGLDSVIYGNMIMVAPGGEMLLCDSEGGQGRLVSPFSYGAKTTVGSMVAVAGSFTLAGGTVDASAISLEDKANGAGFLVLEGGQLNVSGGTVIGGTTWCSALTPPPPEAPAAGENPETTEPTEATEATEPVDIADLVDQQPFEILGKGGSVYVAPGGTCNLSDGEIRDGSGGLGGNVYVDEGGLLMVSGGSITAGESVFHGGNVYVAGTLEMSAGEITLGGSYSNGGNLFVSGKLEMTGGLIAEGTCDVNSMTGKRGGNLCVNGEEAVIHISNATIRDGSANGGEGFGGNISVIGECAREFSVSDTTISGGIGHRGGNLYFGTLSKSVNPENLDFYMRNVTVSNGVYTYRGGNLCMDSDLRGVYVNLVMDDSKFLMEENARETISLGAGAAVDTWATLTMNGGSIEGGSLNLYADAVLTANGTAMTMDNNIGQGELVVNP